MYKRTKILLLNNLKNKYLLKNDGGNPTNKELVDLNNIYFLLCFKLVTKTNEEGLKFPDYVYYEVVPIIFNQNSSKVKDLRTNKIYSYSNDIKFYRKPFYIRCPDLLKDYNLALDLENKNVPNHCKLYKLQDFMHILKKIKLSKQAKQVKESLVAQKNGIIVDVPTIIEIADTIKDYHFDKIVKTQKTILDKERKKQNLKKISEQSMNF